MALYFLSDVHLRLDHPGRGHRLARFLGRLGPGDRVVVVGDLCDFWFASRQARGDVSSCPGLAALRAFRARGGTLELLPGNHDASLGPFYERVLGVGFRADALQCEIDGLRLFVAHGHELGARSFWKRGMESRAFLRAFSALPRRAAEALDRRLERSNQRHMDESTRRNLRRYRRHADDRRGASDVCVLGHVHVVHDDAEGVPRLVVLGNWHERSSYLRVEGGTATLEVVADDGSTAPAVAP